MCPSPPQEVMALRESEHQRDARDRVSLHGPEVQELIANARAEQRVDGEQALGIIRQQLSDTQRYYPVYTLCVCVCAAI